MLGARRGQRDVEGSACRGVWRTLREEEVIPMHLVDGLLLAHYEKRGSRICEEVLWLPSGSQFKPYPPTELTKHGHPIALPYFGARLGGASQSAFQWVYMDPYSYKVFHQGTEAIPLRKATDRVVANFIKENIIARFRVPHRIISDNGTPFMNKEVVKMLEFYHVKHHRSSPYYLQGNK